MTTSADLGLPYIASSQNQPEVTHNDALNLIQTTIVGVIQISLNTPPGSPTSGDTYVVGASPTGAWAGRANTVTIWTGTAWDFIPGETSAGTPITMGARQEGLRVWDKTTNAFYVWTGSAWTQFALEHIRVDVGDETTAITAGTTKKTFRTPYAFTLTGIRASLTTAQASGSILTVDVNESGTTILSTKITIDNTEKTSTTAVTAPVISDTALASDAEITIDVDQVGDGTATGLKVTLIGYKAI